MALEKFSWQVRVYFEDTDAGGIVYYANYLKFCERARTEWLRRLNISQQDFLQQGLGFVIVDLQARYRKSARLDDLLTVNCVPLLVRGAKLKLGQQIVNAQGELLFDFACSLAYVNFKTGRPLPIPEAILAYAKRQQEQNTESSQEEH